MPVATANRISKPSDDQAARSVLSARRHYTAGRFREAEAICRRVLEENGEYGVALHLLGLICGRTGRLPESAALLRRAVKSCPNTPEFRSDLGVTLEGLGDLAGAIDCYRRVIAIVGMRGQDKETRRGGDKERGRGGDKEMGKGAEFATARDRQGDKEMGQNPSRTAHHSSVAQTFTNLANALLHSGDIQSANEACLHGLRLSPGYAPAHNALGCILLEQNLAKEACESFRRAIELWPDFNEAKSNLGRALLTLGEFREGWHHFGYLHAGRVPRHAGRSLAELVRRGDKERGRHGDVLPENSAAKARAKDQRQRTDDEELSGKTILLYGEGGLGNIIQFIRYAPLLAERGARVVFQAPAPLVKLLKPVPGIEQVIADGEVPPTYHAHASIMSLPRIFRTTLDTVPATIPYLSADAKLVEHWGRELESKSQIGNRKSQISRRVGICWQAEQRTAYGRQRTIPLAHFAILSQVPGVQLISLQRGWKGSAAFPITVFSDLDESNGAFMDTAAIMKHLDLVITADTSVAHLAGALGVPVWVALRSVPDWRWMLERADTPWYPTMRLFRQSREGVWRDVFEEMAGVLESDD